MLVVGLHTPSGMVTDLHKVWELFAGPHMHLLLPRLMAQMSERRWLQHVAPGWNNCFVTKRSFHMGSML